MNLALALRILWGGWNALTHSTLLKRVLTRLAAEQVRPILRDYLCRHLSAVEHGVLGRRLIAIGEALVQGRVEDAIDGGAQVIEEVRF